MCLWNARESVKIQSLIQKVGKGAWISTPLTRILMLPVWQVHFKAQVSGEKMGKIFHMKTMTTPNQSVDPLYAKACNAAGVLKRSVLHYFTLYLALQYEFNEMFSLEHMYL